MKHITLSSLFSLMAVLVHGSLALKADCAFAYNPNTLRIAAVAATPSVPYWSVIERQALSRIGCTIADVAAGRAFLVRSSPANTSFTYNAGWVALAMGKQYRVSPVVVVGNTFAPRGEIHFGRTSQQGALNNADWVLRNTVTGSGRSPMWWMTSVACYDLGVTGR